MAKTRHRYSVLPNLFIMLVAVTTLLAALISVAVWNDIKRDRIRELSYTAAAIRDYYELSFKQWGLTLYSMGQRLQQLSEDGLPEQQRKYAEQTLKIYDELLAFGFADTTGQLLVFAGEMATDSLPNLSLSESSRRSFEEAKQSDGISIGEAYFFQNVNDWILPVRMPIRNDEGVLKAVHTSAIRYQNMIDELQSLGISNNHHIHLINTSFNTTQLYTPLERKRFSEVIGKTTDIYENKHEKTLNGGLTYFTARDTVSDHNVYGIGVALKDLDHQLIVSINEQLLWAAFWSSFRFVAIGYAMILLVAALLRVYYGKKEKEFISAIEAEKANLAALVESTNSLIGLFDKNFKLIEYNESFAEYALAIEGVELYHGVDILAHMKRREYAEIFRGFLKRGLSGEKLRETLEYPTEKGSLYFLFNYNPIYHENQIIGVSMFCDDITELKRSEQALAKYNENLEGLIKERTEKIEKQNQELEETLKELRETQRQLIQSEKMASIGVLAAGVGHEINNPLNFIKNGVFALGKHIENNFTGPKESLKPFYDIIGDGVDRAAHIVKSLSFFGKNTKDNNKDCDIHEILENCLVILNSKLRDRIQVVKEFDPDPVVVKGNESQLNQAFLNILTNAEQAISCEGGQIFIQTKRLRDKVKIVIRDNGEGISKEHLSKISDPFFTTKSPGEGTGLGLFIAYSSIEEHHGTIEVHSELNKGTEFVIELQAMINSEQ